MEEHCSRCLVIDRRVGPLRRVLPGGGLKYYWYKMATVWKGNERAGRFFTSDIDFAIEMETHIMYHKYTIHPFSCLRVVWEIVMMLGFLAAYIQVNLFSIDLLCCYMEKDGRVSNQVVYAYLAFTGVQILDIVFNFLSGVPDDDGSEIILDHREIARRYLKGRFILDLISAFPASYILLKFVHSDNRLMRLVFVVQLKTIINAGSLFLYFRHTCEALGVSKIGSRFIVILMALLIYMNWVSLIFWVEAAVLELKHVSDTSEVKTWVTKLDLWKQSLYKKYIFGFYLTALFFFKRDMTNFLGQEEDSACENTIGMFIAISGSMFWFIVIGQIFVLLMGRKSADAKFGIKIMKIKHYLANSRGGNEGKKIALRNFELQYPGMYYNVDKIIDIIGDSLKRKLINVKCDQLLLNIPYLRGLDRKDLEYIASKMIFEAFVAGELIYSEGSTGTLVYFIIRGTVHIFCQGLKLIEVHEGEEFGEMTVITKSCKRLTTALAAVDTTLYCVHSHVIKAILNNYPTLDETMKKTMSVKKAMLFAKLKPQ